MKVMEKSEHLTKDSSNQSEEKVADNVYDIVAVLDRQSGWLSNDDCSENVEILDNNMGQESSVVQVLSDKKDAKTKNTIVSDTAEVPVDVGKDIEVAVDDTVADNNAKTTDDIKGSTDLTEIQNIESEAIKIVIIIEKIQTATRTTAASNNEIADPLPRDMDDTGKKNTFKFYWLDILENDTKQKGTILLFGKIYDEAQRLYMLDDEGRETDETVTLNKVYTEFKQRVTEPMGITTFRHTFVLKKYLFDATVPHESHYMEVRYPFTQPEIDPKLLRVLHKSFSRVFGTNTRIIERFLLDRKIKGPCWLELSNSQLNGTRSSRCTQEIICPTMKYVRKIDCETVPPLVVTALNILYYANEILMISCVTQTAYQFDKQQPAPSFDQEFCVFTSPANQPLPADLNQYLSNYKDTGVKKMGTEKALLRYFIKHFAKNDCDIVVGHDLHDFQLKLLVKRLIKHGLIIANKLNRMKRWIKPVNRLLFTGRLVCDIKISAKEFIRSRTYDLSALCQYVLKEKRVDLKQDEISKMYKQSDDIIKLITYIMQDAAYILKIFYDLNIIPLYMEITKIVGNILSRTLLGGQSERNEFLLLHAFTENGYIVPDKKYYRNDNQGATNITKATPSYFGGLVLEPKIGLYNKYVLLMDFNSLYPSIMLEYNICFSTIQVGNDEDTELPDAGVELGILPIQIRKILESRKQVKQLMKNPCLAPDVHRQYDMKQLALKLVANSIYGCLGFGNSRFSAITLAALITQKGREILKNAKDRIEQMGFEVIYGDTDSIMINTNQIDYDPVIELGMKIKQEINKLYKQIEFDIDGVFKYLLLLKKKKYAAVLLNKSPTGELIEQKEYKGLEVIRRDWSEVATKTGKLILNHILSDQSPDERATHIYNDLVKIKDELMENKIPIQLLTISKQLVKEPHMYANKDVLPHVQVAMRFNKKHGGHYHAGTIISYVICTDGSKRSAIKRAYHTEEMKIYPDLKIDINYYLAEQIFPIVSRICEPLDGIDSHQIAQCLGIEKYPEPSQITLTGYKNITPPAIKFKNTDKFKFTCLSCKTENVISGPLNGNESFLERCTNNECKTRPIDYLYSILNQLTLTMRSYIQKYYTSELICKDRACLHEVIRIPMEFTGNYPVCTVCHAGVMKRAYTEKHLFRQLSYFVYIFDLERRAKKPVVDESICVGYQKLRKLAEDQLRMSKYAVVDFRDLLPAAAENNNNDEETESCTISN